MIDFIDHIAGEGKQGRYKLTKEDGSSENITLELNDDATTNGTPINRSALMSIQGFQTQTITFESDSLGNVTKIIETNDLGQTKTTTFNDNYSITETFIGDKTITKTTNIIQGGITEVVS